MKCTANTPHRRLGTLGLFVIGLALPLRMLAPAASAQEAKPPSTPIQHIVMIVKENRSFDHMFGQFPGVAGATSGLISTGQTLPLQHAPDRQSRDFCHTWNCNVVAVDGGRMDKWDVTVGDVTFACNMNGDYACYSQYQQADLPNYWNLASNYAISDHFFSSIHATSFPNHMYTVAATSDGIMGQPHLQSNSTKGESGCQSDPGSTVNLLLPNGEILNPFPCFDFQSIVDLLDNNPTANGGPISWKYYTPNGSSYDPLEAIDHIRNNATEWGNHIVLDSSFVGDVEAGNLPQVSWLVTDDPWSEHPPWSVCQGENFDMNLVSAIMQNSTYWNNTAIFIYWDDSGGFYDHVFPPAVDEFGLGPRVPLLMVSPYVNTSAGHVVTTQYEPSSILKFIEEVFNLPNMGNRDSIQQTNSVMDAFNFTQSPLPPITLNQRSCSAISNTTLGFPSQQVGSTSAARTVNIVNYNSTSLAVDVAHISTTGDFLQNNNCPASIPPPQPGVQVCTINVVFKPTATGPRSGTLTIPTGTPFVSQFVQLSGVGSNISLTPTPLTFGSLPVGQTKLLTGILKNNGTSSISISSIVAAGDFTQTNSCSSSLSAGSSCNITITFRPSTTGTRYGTITVTDSDGSSPNVLNLTGTGTDLVFNPTSLVFPTISVGKASAPKTLTLTNNGNSTLIISNVAIQGTVQQTDTDFSQTNNCNGSLGPGSSCTFTLQFSPQGIGTRLGNMVIFDSESTTSPQSVALSGVGQANPVPYISDPLSPTKATPGGAQFTLTVSGSGFVTGATVNWNGAPLSTTLVSSSKLTATVPATNIALAGTALITVTNATPGGGVSNVDVFQITSGSTPTNLSKADINVGSTPLGIARADFNGDGKLDLAVANSGSNTLSILLGNGDATFTLKSSPATGAQPTALAVGDFNEDGKLDLAVANQTGNTASILLGNGDGTFTAASVAPQTGAGPVAIIAADTNQDGWLDLGTANFVENLGSLYTGNGDGSFDEISAGANTGQGPVSIAVADFNGDGFLDLAIASKLDNLVTVLPGNGDGTFTSLDGPTPGNQPSAVVAADFNADGKQDLAIANLADSTISIYLGNGDGTFNLQGTSTTGTGPSSLAVGDFNGDGNIDLASANATANTISILTGAGNGTFANHVDSPTGSTPNSLVAGDFNRDGKLDLAVTNSAANTVSILTQGTGTGGPIVSLNPTSLTFATQLVSTTSASQTVMLTNTGTATLNISSVSVSGDYSETSQCGSTVVAGASCNVLVNFKPRLKGNRPGTLSFTDNAPGSPQKVTLTGVGTIVELAPTSLTFGNQTVGTKSPPQTITLTNFSTSSTLTLTAIAIKGTNPGDFNKATTCVLNTAMAPNASCTITVTFKPTATGARSANVNVNDNGGGSPQLVPLSGTGQ